MTSFFQFFVHLVNSRDSIHAKILDVYSFIFIFMNLKLLIIIFQEITYLFIVKFEHRNFDQELDVRSSFINETVPVIAFMTWEKVRGMIPSWFYYVLLPSIVWVFPVPVWPYAKIVPL